MIIIKTGIYVRVSTEEQAKEGFSIRAQQDKLKDYIRLKEWELYDIYADEGISGKNIVDRPEINRLIADVMKKKVENVLVFKIDRLTRNTKDLITLMETFNNNNCSFNSLMESIDTTTASGRMFIKIIGIFAEFERENLIERVSVALEKKVREGYTISGFKVPYGYIREKGNRELTINEEESKIIQEIFLMYLKKHKTLYDIAKTLNMRDIATGSGSEWNASTIKYILTNPTYNGKTRYSVKDESKYFEADGKHEQIISDEIYNEVQNKISKMQKKVLTKRPKEENYYCGTLMCGVCGSKMTTHGIYAKDPNGNQVYYCSYMCMERRKGNCNASRISHTKVDVAFREYIKQYKDLELEEEVNTEKSNTDTTENDLLLAEYEILLSKLLQKEKDIMTLYINDKIDYDEYNKMLEIIRTEKRMYEEKINEMQDDKITYAKIQKEDIVIELKENWDLLTKPERLQFLQTYIKAIYISAECTGESKHKKHVEVKKVEFYRE